MTTINTKTFLENPTRFFNLARNEDVAVKRGKSMYKLMYKPVVEEPQVASHIDEDLHRAISGEEFKRRALEIVEKVHSKFASK